MKKPHKHAELIKAWADGAEIEYRRLESWGMRDWELISDKLMVWYENDVHEYRIKPERKPDVFRNFLFVEKMACAYTFIDVTGLPRNEGEQWIRVYMDGETGKLKSAEVLK